MEKITINLSREKTHTEEVKITITAEQLDIIEQNYNCYIPLEHIAIHTDLEVWQVKEVIQLYKFQSPKKNRLLNGKYFCWKCKQYKTKEEFYKKTQSKEGIASWCIDCTKKKRQERKQEELTDKLFPNRKTKLELNNNKEYKFCLGCNKDIAIDDFSWSKKHYKIQSKCKFCLAKRQQQYILDRIEKKGY